MKDKKLFKFADINTKTVYECEAETATEARRKIAKTHRIEFGHLREAQLQKWVEYNEAGSKSRKKKELDKL